MVRIRKSEDVVDVDVLRLLFNEVVLFVEKLVGMGIYDFFCGLIERVVV